MAYRITYETEKKPRHPGRWARILALGVGLALGFRMRQDGAAWIEALTEALGRGIPEAVEVFCRAVLHG